MPAGLNGQELRALVVHCSTLSLMEATLGLPKSWSPINAISLCASIGPRSLSRTQKDVLLSKSTFAAMDVCFCCYMS